MVRKSGNTTYVTTVGNLAPTRDPGCITLTEADNKLSPPDLFLGVIHCLKADRAADAVDLFVLMGGRASFDTLRVTDKTAHDAGQVLSLQLRTSVLPKNIAALQAALADLGKPGTPEWQVFCQRYAATGVPAHDPGYMISHGMGAIAGSTDAPLVVDFDTAAAWTTTLDRYVHCSG